MCLDVYLSRFFFFFSSRRRHTRFDCDWSSDVCSSDLAVAYRRSWLKEAGAHEYPKTWDEARKLFAQLKAKGKPYGQTLGHTFGDAPTFCYPMLWCFGGAETDKTGKKVILNGKGAIESVKFMQAFWKECCDE